MFPSNKVIAVGRPVAQPPPHRSRRAVFPHRALQADSRPQSGLGTPSGPSRRRTPDAGRTRHPAVVPQVPNPGPRIAPPLAATMAPCAQEASHTGAARLQAGRVPVDARVVGVSPPLGVYLPAPVLPPLATLRLAPVGSPLARVSPRLARRTALAVGLARPGSPPATRTAQNVDAGMAGHRRPGARDPPRLTHGPFPSDLATPLAPRPVTPLRVGLLGARAHAIIRVAHQARVAPPAGRDPLVNPPVQRLVQVHLRAEG